MAHPQCDGARHRSGLRRALTRRSLRRECVRGGRGAACFAASARKPPPKRPRTARFAASARKPPLGGTPGAAGRRVSLRPQGNPPPRGPRTACFPASARKPPPGGRQRPPNSALPCLGKETHPQEGPERRVSLPWQGNRPQRGRERRVALRPQGNHPQVDAGGPRTARFPAWARKPTPKRALNAAFPCVRKETHPRGDAGRRQGSSRQGVTMAKSGSTWSSTALSRPNTPRSPSTVIPADANWSSGISPPSSPAS